MGLVVWRPALTCGARKGPGPLTKLPHVDVRLDGLNTENILLKSKKVVTFPESREVGPRRSLKAAAPERTNEALK